MTASLGQHKTDLIVDGRSLVLVLLLIAGCDQPAPRPDPLDSLAMPKAAYASSTDANSGRPRLEEIEIFGTKSRDKRAPVRVVLAFNGAPVFQHESLPASGVLPRRLAIHLPGVEFDPGLSRVVPVEAGGLTRVRLGEPDPRVVLDLDRRAQHRVFSFSDPHRIVIDIRQGKNKARPKKGPVVVLDPGHGGRETGTAHLGLVESRLALDLTKRTARTLRTIMPRARVVLTRNSDVSVSLAERTAIANAFDADVFVSIHLNGSSEPIRRGGVTTFVLDVSNDEQALRLAARENGTTPDQVSGIQGILANLHREGQLKRSKRLARHVQGATLAGGRKVLAELADRGVRNAMFYVLVGATMPAVLVEASFLTRDQEAEALRTPGYRRALAQGMAQGIARYLETL